MGFFQRPASHETAFRSGVSLLLALGLGGCAEPRWDYEKRGVTAVRLERDLRECRREAFDPNKFGLLHRVDQKVLNRCMERRGYEVRQAE